MWQSAEAMQALAQSEQPSKPNDVERKAVKRHEEDKILFVF